MPYRTFGKTGIKVSALGFGAMRLPEIERNGLKQVDQENAVKVIRRAFEQGVNYIDTAYFYHDGQSEVVVGQAIKGWRDRIYLSSKSPGRGDEATINAGSVKPNAPRRLKFGSN